MLLLVHRARRRKLLELLAIETATSAAARASSTHSGFYDYWICYLAGAKAENFGYKGRSEYCIYSLEIFF